MNIYLCTPDECGCDLQGDGTERDPVRIAWCPLHAAACSMHKALAKMPCQCLGDFQAPDTESEKHLSCCPKAIAKCALADARAVPVEACHARS